MKKLYRLFLTGICTGFTVQNRVEATEQQTYSEKKFRFIIILFWFCISIHAQTKFYVFRLLDENTKEPIPFAYAVLKGKNISSLSNEFGVVKIKADFFDTLIVSQTGYFLKRISVKDIEKTDSVIFLKRKEINLNEVTVITKTLEVFQENTNMVYLDFDFYDDLIVSLVNKGEKNNSLLLSDKNGNKISEKPLKFKAELLYKDCLGNLHVATRDSIFQLFYDYVNIKLLAPYPISKLTSVLMPCECYYDGKYIFKSIHYQRLKNTYTLFESKNNVYKNIAFVADSENIRDFNLEFDLRYFLNLRKAELEKYQTSVTELSKNLETLREKMDLPQEYSRLLKRTASEMKKIDTSFVLFDYTHQVINYYSLNGKPQHQLKFNFSGVEAKIYIDSDARNYIFTNLDGRNGILTLYRFDVIKNAFTHKYAVTNFHFIKYFKIKENFLYFINKDQITGHANSKIVKNYILWEKL
jgi:hypothetical protein